MKSPRTQESGDFFNLIPDMEDFVTVLSLEICRKYDILNKYNFDIVRFGSRLGGARDWPDITESRLSGAVIYIQGLIPINEDQIVAYNGNKFNLTNEHLRVYNDLMHRAAEEGSVQ